MEKSLVAPSFSYQGSYMEVNRLNSMESDAFEVLYSQAWYSKESKQIALEAQQGIEWFRRVWREQRSLFCVIGLLCLLQTVIITTFFLF